MKQKVFCIGFHKTGTTSLKVALNALGYKVTGPNGSKDPDIEHNVHTMIESLVNEYDAFQDNPWPILYREIDGKYPNSKFILTLRNPDSWLQSQVRHFGKITTPMRTWIYGVGCPQGNEDIYLERFSRHNREVLEYFKNRESDLLVIDLAEDNGWDKLCPFLGMDIPDIPFPHANKALDREKSNKFGKKLKNLITKLWN